MGSNLVIVAIPDENDRVWKVSSEKIPHLTLLFLGEAEKVKNSQQIVEFVEHAANTTLSRFYLPVDRRDELGDDKADVLFFKRTRYDFKAVNDFRVNLLKDPNIKTAYDSTEQFEGPWKPHLTLGYPSAPANSGDHLDDPFYDICFNKVAVWFGDFEGPDFLLKDYWDEEMDSQYDNGALAMSDINQARVQLGLDTIEHIGVKGMKWGQRKTETVTLPDFGSGELKESEDSMEQTAELGVEFLEHYGAPQRDTAGHGAIFTEGLLHASTDSDVALEHVGVKGMRWGVRSKREAPVAVAPQAMSRVPHGTKRKTKIETEGGENHPAADDAIKVAQARVKLAKSGPAALSNKELQDIANRVELEARVVRVTQSPAKKFVKNLLKQQGEAEVGARFNADRQQRLRPAQATK